MSEKRLRLSLHVVTAVVAVFASIAAVATAVVTAVVAVVSVAAPVTAGLDNFSALYLFNCCCLCCDLQKLVIISHQSTTDKSSKLTVPLS